MGSVNQWNDSSQNNESDRMSSTEVEENQPVVSIGIPVYNESRYIQQSLLSIIEQEYNNIELIVSDNCSTDNTYEICRKTLMDHDNVSLNRFDSNMGATYNFSFVLNQAKGKYFMWASGHDLWAPDYISRNVALLEQETKAVIAFGSSEWIDANGNPFDRYYGYTDTRGMSALSRLFTVYYGNMHPILGLIRKSALEQTKPLIPMVGADLILLTELSLMGDFVHTNKTEWMRREFRHEPCHNDKLKRYSSKEYGLTRSYIDILFPLFRLPLHLIRVILQSKLNPIQKASAMIALCTSLPVRYLAGKVV